MEKKPLITRRKFLAGSVLASAGLEFTTGQYSDARSLQSTGTPGKKLVGCYVSINAVLNNPKYIDALQKRLGVNTLICGSAIKIPKWIRDMNPPIVKNTHRDDDSGLHKAIEETHRRGMNFWIYLYANHHYYGEEGRHLISETFEGINYLDLPPIKYSLEYLDEASICVSKPTVRDYEIAYFGYTAKMYDVDTVYVSHHRYANPSFWTNLFGCACSYCQHEADQMGYNFSDMRNSMLNLRRNLQNLDRKTLEQAAKFRLTFTDFLTFIGEDNGVIDWFVFRAKIRSNQLKRLTSTVHLMSNNRSTFVIDTHPATLALLVGHIWEDFIDGASDAIYPLSWLGWHYISPVAAWANQLCEWVPGLEESIALKLVISLFGWEELGLPDKRIADLRIGESSSLHGTRGPVYQAFFDFFNPNLTLNLITHEWIKMAAINRGRLPAHPVIKGREWPENVCRELMDRADDLGLTGYVFQGTDLLIDRNKL